MSKKNKIYWLEGVTEKGVKDLLNNDNSKLGGYDLSATDVF